MQELFIHILMRELDFFSIENILKYRSISMIVVGNENKILSISSNPSISGDSVASSQSQIQIKSPLPDLRKSYSGTVNSDLAESFSVGAFLFKFEGIISSVQLEISDGDSLQNYSLTSFAYFNLGNFLSALNV